MKKLLLVPALLFSFAIMAQKAEPVKVAGVKIDPPKEDPAKMKPEMTEFWDQGRVLTSQG